MDRWNLIIDDPAGGAHNMAADEALMESVAAGRRGPTLRFYQWRPACLSLGVFQKFADYQRLTPAGRPPDVVRRVTGGGAIWHDREWTYSVHLPRGHPLCGRDANPLYQVMHGAILAGLRRLGVPSELRGAACGLAREWNSAKPQAACREPDPDSLFCFTRSDANDIVAPDGRKLVGSAQRRLDTVVLQHGSIVLATPPGSPLATSVEDQLGRPADPEAVLGACRSAMAEQLGLTWRDDAFTDAERRRSDELLTTKHAHPDWLARR